MIKEFKQTCDLPYDKHQYKVVVSNGKSIVLDSYEEVQYLWASLPDDLSACIEVLDRVKKDKKTLKKGFI